MTITHRIDDELKELLDRFCDEHGLKVGEPSVFESPYCGEGVACRSPAGATELGDDAFSLNGLPTPQAKQTIIEWLGNPLPSRRQVAATFASQWHASQAVGQRLSLDHQNAFVASDDLGEVALCHDGGATVIGECLENDIEVRVIRLDPEYRGTTHPVQGFENDIRVLLVEAFQPVLVGAYQQRWTALRELGRENLLIAVAQAPAAIDDQRTLALGLFQDVGAIDEFVVEGRILAHQYDVQLREPGVSCRTELDTRPPVLSS